MNASRRPTVILALLTAALGGCERSGSPPSTARPASSSIPNAVVQEDWPVFRGQASLTGLAGGQIPERPALLWRFRAQGPIASSPVIAGGRVYFGSDDGSVYALSFTTGEAAWSTRPGGAKTPPIVEAPPVIADGRVYVGDHGGRLWCLSADCGDVLWSYPAGEKIVGSAAVWKAGAEARIAVGSHDNFVHCVDASGARRWIFETGSFLNGAPAIAGDRLVIGGCDGRLHVVAAETGERVGSHEIGTYVAGSAAVAGGRAFFGHFAGRVVCMDIARGTKVWEYGEGDLPFFSSPAVDGSRVVIGGRDKRIHCIERETGRKVWTCKTGGRVEGSPVICGSRVVAASEDGRVYVLDLATGDRVWSYDVGAPIVASPAVAAGRIVIGAQDGCVYAFGEQ